MRFKKLTREERKQAKEEAAKAVPPDVRRRRVRASKQVLVAQEAAAQVRNDANRPLREAHESRTKLPSLKALREAAKGSASAAALGRAKQVQYVIDDAVAMFGSYRSNFFGWVADPSSRPGQPRPPRFYRRGQRCRLRFDYQDFRVDGTKLHLPDLVNLPAVDLVDRYGAPLLGLGDRLVEVRIEPCRSRQWVDFDLVIKRAETAPPARPKAGHLFVDLGVRRLVTCLDDRNLTAFYICGGLAKAILTRGAKWHALWRSFAAQGGRHGKARAGALAARSARQMDDLMKKVARALVQYALAHHLQGIAIGRNKDWKQGIDLGRKQNQLFTFIPHGTLVEALRTGCRRAGIDFVETEESYTSKTDHLAFEPMGDKPEEYRWLGSRSRGCFRSSVGTVLQADVNGCLGIGRKVVGEEWLKDLLRRLGPYTGTRLVPRRVHVNGRFAPAPSPGDRTPPIRGASSRAWISTQVALVKAGLAPASSVVAQPTGTHYSQRFPKAA